MKFPMEKQNIEKPRIEEGFYTGRLEEVKEVSEGKFGKRIAWIFSLAFKGKIVELAKVTYAKFSVGSAATEVMEALGGEFVVDAEVDTDKFIGQTARLVVEDYEDSEGNKVSTISKVKPLSEDDDLEIPEEIIAEMDGEVNKDE